MKTQVNILWFKKDLRLGDHRPLQAAIAAQRPLVPLYVIEADYWALPDTSWRQWLFTRGCLEELSRGLSDQAARLVVRQGDVIGVLKELQGHYAIEKIFAHEETGNAWTYARDRRVRTWCRKNGIEMKEYPQFGVIRGAYERDDWAKRWDAFMSQPVIPVPASIKVAQGLDAGQIVDPPMVDCGIKELQPPGRQTAQETLTQFLYTDGQTYQRDMSSPLSAEKACSRMSPHLCYGAMSMREVYHQAREAQAYWRRKPPFKRGQWLKSLNAFIGRLHWHCHFIQKLEDQPDIESKCLNPLTETLRATCTDSEKKFLAWCHGTTGFPFIDACMRFLIATGWINFRMRALLMSFASYHLWLDWRQTAPYLARLFTDYEPGIHYSQVQMQSGTTAINTFRIYNPLKQSHDQDPKGVFIKRWVPELGQLSGKLVHAPHEIRPLEAYSYRDVLKGYPAPLVDHVQAAKEARERLWGLKKTPEYKAWAQKIYHKHGSRKR